MAPKVSCARVPSAGVKCPGVFAQCPREKWKSRNGAGFYHERCYLYGAQYLTAPPANRWRSPKPQEVGRVSPQCPIGGPHCGHTGRRRYLHFELGSFGLSALSQLQVSLQSKLGHVALASFLDLLRRVVWVGRISLNESRDKKKLGLKYLAVADPIHAMSEQYA